MQQVFAIQNVGDDTINLGNELLPDNHQCHVSTNADFVLVASFANLITDTGMKIECLPLKVPMEMLIRYSGLRSLGVKYSQVLL